MFYSLPIVAFTLTACLPVFVCHSLAALDVVPSDFAVLVILHCVTALAQEILSLTSYATLSRLWWLSCSSFSLYEIVSSTGSPVSAQFQSRIHMLRQIFLRSLHCSYNVPFTLQV